jgi:hypothetical protein
MFDCNLLYFFVFFQISSKSIILIFSDVESFAKDWIRGNWYFVDPVLLRVSVCSENGLFCQVLANKDSQIVGPRSLVLDPLDG